MIIWALLRGWCGPIPQRFIVATMVMSGLAISYVNRLAVNLALTEIVFSENATEEYTEQVCHYNDTIKPGKVDNAHAEFHWSGSDQANVLGGFYIGYIVAQVPGGVLVDWFGPKKVLGYGVLLSMLITLFTPLMARTNIYLLVLSRVTMGLAQGPLYPALSVFVARWSLPHERNFINSYIGSGVVVGGILSNALTGYLLYNLNKWDDLFYIYGVATLLWYILWVLLAHEDASSHPFISKEEQQKLNNELKSELNLDGPRMKIPYHHMAKSIPVWAMISANCGHGWAFFIIVTMLPQYMSRVLRFNVRDNGFLNSLPYIGRIVVALSSAKLAETLVKKEYLSKTVQCKIWSLFSTVIPCVVYLIASYVGCDRVIVVILFVAATASQGTTYSSLRVVNVDMSPNFSGTLMSLLNTAGALCGYLTPVVFAFFTTEQTVTNWRYAFWLSFGVVSLTTTVFLIWGTSKIQPWNFPPEAQHGGEDDDIEQCKPNGDNTI